MPDRLGAPLPAPLFNRLAIIGLGLIGSSLARAARARNLAAAIVAIDDQNRVCLLHQFRHAAGGYVWELPAGKLEPGEPPELTAQRELIEEAGVAASTWCSLGISLSSPGVFTERIHLYLATNLTSMPDAREAAEIFEVHWVDFKTAVQRVLSGEIDDSKTGMGLLRAWHVHGEKP